MTPRTHDLWLGNLLPATMFYSVANFLFHGGLTMRMRNGFLFAAFLATCAFPAAAQTSGSSACPETVTIETGDTLGGIAARCGTTVEAIRDANPDLGDPRRLQVGAEVRIPVASEIRASDTAGAEAEGDGTGYVIRQGDTWDSIARATGVEVEALMELNPEIASVALNEGARITLPPRSDKGPPPTLPAGGSVKDPENSESIPSADQPEVAMGLRVAGRLVDEGVECPALRSLDGSLYTLSGDIGEFETGDEVVVTGREVETSTCMQGKTIAVESIAPAS